MAACAPQPPAPVAYDAEPAPAPSLERRVVLAVKFDLNSHRVRRDGHAALGAVASALDDPRLHGPRFEINGHTDVSGRLGCNVGPSVLRAAVADDPAARGAPRERMRPQGFGPLQPFDPVTLRGALNRRVEIVALR